MKWILPNNKVINVNIGKFLIDWKAPAASMEAQVVQDFLKKHCQTHVVLTEFVIPKSGKLRVDYMDLTLKFAWEHMGAQHNNFIRFWHGNRIGFHSSIKRDIKKMELLEKNGFTFIETVKDDFPLTKAWIESNFQVYL